MEPLNDEVCYRAVRGRDPRFDGRFFTAVRTTGVYCRPICPARLPLLKNVQFFVCAAAAEEAGFRPCLRCRPESAPGSPGWAGVEATVERALRLISDGGLDEHGVETLAGRVGVGARHLSRLFVRSLGATPQAIARTQRVHFARQLLATTELPMAQVAFAAGFRSVRQFNEVIRSATGAAPSALRPRRARAGSSTLEASAVELTLRLAYRPPLDFDALLRFLGARATPGVEQVIDGAYQRVHGTGWVRLRRHPERELILLEASGLAPGDLRGVVRRARRLLDLDAHPEAIAEALGRSPQLAPAVRARPGLRVPGAWEPFETLTRAILGQQVSVAAATTLAGRLAARFGEPLDGLPPGLSRAFPTPTAIARGDLSGLGITTTRIEALQAAARLALGHELEVSRLQGLPGVGPWTEQYVAMRFSDPDAFPAGDLVLRRAAAPAGQALSEPRLLALSQAWRPYRAYAAIHLWTSSTTHRPAPTPRASSPAPR
jgi:AraC family transcriptional regulator of adaptative response / DNA-3-methyladenine glycosylase II